VLTYLREITPNTRVALFKLGSTLEVLHDFTADVDSLRKRLDESGPKLAPQTMIPLQDLANDYQRLLAMFGERDRVVEKLVEMVRDMLSADMRSMQTVTGC
jgi:hypothetical protein